MSYTIIVDEAGNKRSANVTNRALRHCRIGKVTRKSVAIDRFGIVRADPRHWAPQELWPPPLTPFGQGGYVANRWVDAADCVPATADDE